MVLAWSSRCFWRCSFSTVLLPCSTWPKHPSMILHTAPSVLVSRCLLKAEQPSASQCIRIGLLEKSVVLSDAVSTRALSLWNVFATKIVYQMALGELFTFYRRKLQRGLHNNNNKKKKRAFEMWEQPLIILQGAKGRKLRRKIRATHFQVTLKSSPFLEKEINKNVKKKKKKIPQVTKTTNKHKNTCNTSNNDINNNNINNKGDNWQSNSKK